MHPVFSSIPVHVWKAMMYTSYVATALYYKHGGCFSFCLELFFYFSSLSPRHVNRKTHFLDTMHCLCFCKKHKCIEIALCTLRFSANVSGGYPSSNLCINNMFMNPLFVSLCHHLCNLLVNDIIQPLF